ncbi:Bardet-Biedl syndrome 10 protein [Hemitrygon akajei]|uniref:Bardet-Biedl syndrome 10 protein n=1 Tax=Hemitrygon akajei TaxID=2704970 RepID=UPI003BF95393
MGCDGALDIENLVHIAETLENIVSPCFGPLGGQVLFTRATGDILITRDGGTILESLLLDHPAARWMVNCALCHRRQTGDGAKSFLLLLTALLRAAQTKGAGVRQQLAQGLAQLERDVLPRLLAQGLGPHCTSALGPGPAQPRREAVDRVLVAYLSGRVAEAQAPLLTGLACELLWRLSDGAPGPGPALDLCVSHPTALLVVAGGLSVGHSQVLEGLPLSRGLAVHRCLGPTKALLLSGSLAPALSEPGLTLRPSSAAALAEARLWVASRLEQDLARLRELDIGLLLSGPRQSDRVLEAAEASGLALVHGLPDDELALLGRLTGTRPVSQVAEAQAADTVQTCFVQPLGAGPGPQLLLGLAGCRDLRPHCLRLCAPILGLAQQHRNAIAGAYQLLTLLLPGRGDLWWEGSKVGDPGREAAEAGDPETSGWEEPDRDGLDPGILSWEGAGPGKGSQGPDPDNPGWKRNIGLKGPNPGSRREVFKAGSPGSKGERSSPEARWMEREGTKAEAPESSMNRPGAGSSGWEGPFPGALERKSEGQNPVGGRGPGLMVPGREGENSNPCTLWREGPNLGDGMVGPNPGIPWRGRGAPFPETAGLERERDELENPGREKEGVSADGPGRVREGAKPDPPGWWQRDDPETPGTGSKGSNAGVSRRQRESQCACDLGKTEAQNKGKNSLSIERTRSEPSRAVPSPLTPTLSPKLPFTRPVLGNRDAPSEWQLPAGCVLPPGGAFEFLLHHHLQQECARQLQPTMGLACRVLAQALLNIPLHLYRGPSPGRELLQAHTKFLQQLWEGQVMPGDRGSLEVVAAKVQLVSSTLQCLRGLLKVDRAVAVRGRLASRGRAEDEDLE